MSILETDRHFGSAQRLLPRAAFSDGCTHRTGGVVGVPDPAVVAVERQKGRVDNVHTLGFGSGRTWVGSGRIPHVSAGGQCLQGLECSSSPTSGTA